jgi:protein O-mannosyl-transferase
LAVNSSPWRARWLSARAPLLLAALTLLAYSNSFTGGFTLDSKQAILQDQRVHEATGHNLDLIVEHTYWWPYDESGLYRPLTTLSFLFNYAILGSQADPVPYHILNLLLHLANVLLVYALARRYTPYALAAAALWAVHPVLTECVTNLAGRADLLATFGMLAALWFYTAEGKRLWLPGMVVATAIAVFSKESAIVLPALLPLFDRERRRLIGGLLATAVPIAAMLAARTAVLAAALPRFVPFTDNPIVGADFLTGRVAALSVLGRYIWLLAWPARLSADYSWHQIPVAANWAALATLAVVAAIAIRWNWRVGAFAAIAILPVSNLLFPIGTIMAERFLYVPAIAAALAVAQLCRRPAGRIVVCAIVLALACRTWARNPDWQDDRAMAESLVRTSPASFKGHRLLAYELFQAHADPARVLAEAEKSVAPLEGVPDARDSAETWRLAGGYFAAAGKYQRSAELLERALRIVRAQQARVGDAKYAGMANVLDTLADDYLALGRRDDAAITLMAGQLSTGNLIFRNRLLELYRGDGCALMPGPNGPAINPQCPAVHRHLCAALSRAGTTAESDTYGCNK